MERALQLGHRPMRVLLSALVIGLSRADFLLAAGVRPPRALLRATNADLSFCRQNWTHSTNLFADYHFVPGVNEAGEWDLLTGVRTATSLLRHSGASHSPP